MSELGHLWWRKVLAGPDGELTTERSSSSSTNDEGEKYVVLPRAADPRVLVDHTCDQALQDAVDRMVSTRTSNLLIRRLGNSAPSLLKRGPKWTVQSNAELGTLREHLSEVLGEEIAISLSVGPPRVNRKPVVRCYRGNEVIAVAKLGADSHTSLMTRNEAAWLETLEENPINGVKTPRLLHLGSYGSSVLLVMETLELADDSGVSLSQMPVETMSAFLHSHFDPDLTLSETPWWNQLDDRLGVLCTPLTPTLERIGADPLLDELAISAWHGDFSPWNVGFTNKGALTMWDWERAMVGVPVGFDLLHLHYQYGAGLNSATLGLGELGVPVLHHRLLQGLYLLEICARNVEAVATGTDSHHKAMRRLHEMGW